MFVRVISLASISKYHKLPNITKLRLPTSSTTTAVAATAPMKPAAEAGVSARRKAPGLSPAVVTTEGATGADTALTARWSVPSRSRAVSVEGSGHCARTVINSGTRPSPVKSVPVVKYAAARVVPGAAINWISAVPIEAPMAPAPSKAAEPADSEADPERKVRTAKPDSGVRVPPRPCHDGISVNQPGIVRRDVNNFGVARHNIDVVRAIRTHGLLRRALKIAGLLCLPAHHLHSIHHILLLVVIGIA